MKKTIALLLAVLLLLSTACQKNDASDTPTTTTKSETTTAIIETNTSKQLPDYMKLYNEIKNDYLKLIEFRLSDDFNEDWISVYDNLPLSDSFRNATEIENKDLSYHWSCSVIELSFSNETTVDSFGYILCDLNSDDIPELFFVNDSHDIISVFTCKGDSVVLLDAFWTRYLGYVSEEKELYTKGSGGALDNHTSVLFLDADFTLQEAFGFSSESNSENYRNPGYYEFINNEKTEIDKERFENLCEMYPHKHSSFWMSLPIEPLK